MHAPLPLVSTSDRSRQIIRTSPGCKAWPLTANEPFLSPNAPPVRTFPRTQALFVRRSGRENESASFSLSNAGLAGSSRGPSRLSAISTDGRWIAFETVADNGPFTNGLNNQFNL